VRPIMPRVVRYAVLGVAVSLISLFATRSATAQQSGATDGLSAFWHGDTLTGDWGGDRTWLADHGVTFSMTYTGDLQANTRGGIKQGAVYDSLLQPQVDLDLEKLIGWKGLTARISAVALAGPSLSSGYVGNLANVSSINGRPAIRLYNAWLQQNLAGDAVSVRAGLMNVDAEFFISSTASLFVNSTFGWPAILALDLPGGGPAYPLSAPGVRVKLQPTPELAIMAAVFSGDPTGHDGSNSQSVMQPDGTLVSFNGGVLAIAEADLSLNQGKDAKGIPITLKFGGWYHSSTRFADQEFDNDGLSLADPDSDDVPRNHVGDWGMYGIIDTMLYAAPGGGGSGLSAFTRVAGAPDDENLVSFYTDGGLTYKGLLAQRKDDTAGIAVAYLRISNQARSLDLDMRQFGDLIEPVRNQEVVLELSYQAQINPWWTLQPDLQGILDPGGHVANADGHVRPDALVIGLRTTVTF
jgi:porin